MRSRLLIAPVCLPLLTVEIMLSVTAAAMKHILAIYVGLGY